MTAAPQETAERLVKDERTGGENQTHYRRRATDKLPPEKPRASGMRAATTWAILLFCLGNFALSFYNPIDFDPYNFLYRGWTWWGFNDMKKSTHVHNVALLGSSLMVSAVAGVDANYLNKTLDLSQYHKAFQTTSSPDLVARSIA